MGLHEVARKDRAPAYWPLIQTLIVALSCVPAYYITRSVAIIPKSVLPLPPVFLSVQDLWQIIAIFAISVLIQTTLVQALTRKPPYAGNLRFSLEYLCFLLAYTAASLYWFLATTISYDSQVVAAIGLIATAAYFLVYVVLAVTRRREGVLAAFAAAVGATLRRLVRPTGLLTLVFFLSPVALGVAFSKSRDVANVVTQVRMFFNPVPGLEWGFRNFLAGRVFEQPLLVTQAPGDAQSIYILERVGRVYRASPDEAGEPELIIDIADQLGVVEVENGALGMAFHPSFERGGEKPFLYLYYTDTRPEGGQVNRLSRFDLTGSTVAQRTASEYPLMELNREASGFHNGGAVVFGPDKYLYIAVGEGVRTPEGKLSSDVLRSGILRIDVDTELQRGRAIEPYAFGVLQGYRVPDTNPFVGNSAVRDEYWAMGLRNPFRISFDVDTGALWAGDVGSTVWEEVNLIRPGQHYGFPVIEGREESGLPGWEDLGLPYQEPIYTYVHTAYDRAVIGGVVVNGSRYPDLTDSYVFADNYSSKIFAIPSSGNVVEEAKLLARANQFAQRGVSSLTQLASGEILVTTLGAASQPGGEVLELVSMDEADAELPASSVASADVGPISREEAAALFNSNCTRCHGREGDGQGPDAELLGVPIANFTEASYAQRRSSAEIRSIIEDGGAQHGLSPLMPPWGPVLEARELEALVEYILSLADVNGPAAAATTLEERP